MRASVMSARRNADLINEIVRRLPVGVSVQDSEGRVQLINNAAAKVYPNRSAESLMGHYPPGFMKHEFLDRLRSGVQTQETEAIIAEQMKRAKKILTEHAEQHHQLAEMLVEREVITHEDVERVLGPRQWKSRGDEIITANNEAKQQEEPEQQKEQTDNE